MQPAQVCLVDFDPALATGHFHAVLERQANALLVKAGVVTVAAAQREQRPKKVHGRTPCWRVEKSMAGRHDTAVTLRLRNCVDNDRVNVAGWPEPARWHFVVSLP
jgi:hypothetical protein